MPRKDSQNKPRMAYELIESGETYEHVAEKLGVKTGYVKVLVDNYIGAERAQLDLHQWEPSRDVVFRIRRGPGYAWTHARWSGRGYRRCFVADNPMELEAAGFLPRHLMFEDTRFYTQVFVCYNFAEVARTDNRQDQELFAELVKGDHPAWRLQSVSKPLSCHYASNATAEGTRDIMERLLADAEAEVARLRLILES